MNPTNCTSRAVPRQTDQTMMRKMGFDACKQLVPPGRSVGAAFPPRTLLSDQLRSKAVANFTAGRHPVSGLRMRRGG
jgi:hypothetical protein